MTVKKTLSMTINGRAIGSGAPCFIIAEAGVNHGGKLDTALRMVDVAATAKADAVKFQTFRTDRLVTPTAPKANYQRAGSEDACSQRDMLRELELSAQDHYRLMEHCKELGIEFLSTPFDDCSADFLNRLDVPAFKISSGDLTNFPFLEKISAYGKPMIISTGMASMAEVAEAYSVVKYGEVALLHCTSSYPTRPQDANLRAIDTLATAFPVPIGYSDHTLGIVISFAAVARGAAIIEKHFTLNRNSPGPDQRVSIEPEELKQLVDGVRSIEAAIGSGEKMPLEAEANTALVVRKSLVAARNIPAGSTITRDMVAIMRPGTGLPPSVLSRVVGKVARTTISEGKLITLEELE